MQQIIKPQKRVFCGFCNIRVAPGHPLLAIIMSLSVRMKVSALFEAIETISNSSPSKRIVVADIFLTLTIGYNLPTSSFE